MMKYYTCGQIIKALRIKRGMTQEDLAFDICSVSSLSKIENGRQTPHFATFLELMKRIGVSVDEEEHPEKFYHLQCFGIVIGEDTDESS